MFEYKKSTKFKTAFAGSVETIRGYLCDIGNTYLLICYNVWEINANRSYERAGYKNIVDALEKELGFKKSTTYNMLNVVKTYGADEKGKISYKQLITFSKFSYSQLVEMLSLGSEQRKKVTPETPVSAIRMLKKPEKVPVPETSSPAPASEEFQTSGKVSSSIPSDISGFSLMYSLDFDAGEVFCKFDSSFLDRFSGLISDLDILYNFLTPCLLQADFSAFDPDELERRFSSFINVYRSAYNDFKKQLDLKENSAV